MSIGAERVLSQRELNRAVLARQLLLERRRDSLPRALERVGGLQAQYAPSMYIGLWSRLAGFERDQLTRALERRSVVQATLMRVTIHLVSAADYWPLTIAVRAARRESWMRARPEMSEDQLRAAAERAKRRLADGPLARSELIEDMDARSFNGIGMWLDLVRVPPAGTWERRRADIYATAESWLGPPSVTPAEGLELLIRRYLQGFGPAAPANIANWAGLPPREVNDAVERLELRRFRDEAGGLLVDLPRLALPGGRHARPGALPADVGRHAARALPPGADPARGAPAQGLPHEDSAVGSHVPGGRRRGRHVASRARSRGAAAVREARPRRARAARRGGAAARRVPRVTARPTRGIGRA